MSDYPEIKVALARLSPEFLAAERAANDAWARIARELSDDERARLEDIGRQIDRAFIFGR